LRGNCLLKHVIEGKIGKIEGTRRRGKRSKQLLDGLKEAIRYWILQEEAPDGPCLENSFWKRLWSCRKTDVIISDYKYELTSLPLRHGTDSVNVM
jgi:hypothetical protein